jgi:hypothetical protein
MGGEPHPYMGGESVIVSVVLPEALGRLICPSCVNCVVVLALILFSPSHYSCCSFTMWYYK